MFQLANCLLLALFFAAAFDLWAAVRAAAPGPHRLRRALGALWGQEHFLLGGWGGAWRAKVGCAVFCVSLGAYEFSVAFCNSMARENWPAVQSVLAPALDWVVFGGFALKILLGTRYTWGQLVPAGAIYFIGRWVYFNSQNVWLLGMLLAVLAAKDVPLRRAMRAFLAAGLAAVSAVFALYFAGVVAPDAVNERGDSVRLMFGYGHPNTLGGLVLGLVLAWVLLRAARLSWAALVPPAAASVFLWVWPKSRTAALCIFLLVLGLAAGLLARRPHRVLPAGLCAASVPVTLALSVILTALVVKVGPYEEDIAPAWLARLDSLLTCRISTCWTGCRLYDVKIAGQLLPADGPVLDNFWFYTLYNFGPVVLAIVFLLAVRTLWRLGRAGRLAEMLCLTAVVLYGCTESQPWHVTTAPAALLLCAAVYALPRAAWEAEGASAAPQ